jgi:deoxyribodipyrimidine photo-lyase
MKTAVVWFRQDLRILDNPALSEACSKHDHIIALYILETYM